MSSSHHSWPTGVASCTWFSLLADQGLHSTPPLWWILLFSWTPCGSNHYSQKMLWALLISLSVPRAFCLDICHHGGSIEYPWFLCLGQRCALLSSPVTILCRNWMPSVLNLCRFSSQSFFLKFFCSWVSTCGMNFRDTWCSCKSLCKMCWTVALGTPVAVNKSHTDCLLSCCSCSLTLLMLSWLRPLLGLPVQGWSFVSVSKSPCRNFLCHALTCVFPRALSTPYTLHNCLQHLMGVALWWARNLMMPCCSSLQCWAMSEHQQTTLKTKEKTLQNSMNNVQLLTTCVITVIYIYHDHPLSTAMAFHSHSNSHSQS